METVAYRNTKFKHFYPPDGPLIEPYVPWKRPMTTCSYFTRLAAEQRRADALDALAEYGDELLEMLAAWREVGT